MSDWFSAPTTSQLLTSSTQTTDVPAGTPTKNGKPVPQTPAPAPKTSDAPSGSVIPDISLDPFSLMMLAKNIQSIYTPAYPGAQRLTDMLNDPNLFPDRTQQLAEASRLSGREGELPTEADQAAEAAKLKAQGADDLLKRLDAVPPPQQGELLQPNLPQLNLPGAPQTARPQVNPLASLIALGAGLAAPQAAGQFHAAALEGAIKGAHEENARRQQANKEEITRRSLVYDSLMAASKERQRVLEMNRDAAFQNSVLTTDKQLSLAKARSEQFMASNTAKSIKDFADKYDPVTKDVAKGHAMYEAIDSGDKHIGAQVKSVTELLGAVNKANEPNTAMGLAAFEALLKESVQHKNNADIAQRERAQQEALDRRMQQQNLLTGQRELQLATINASEAFRRLTTEEAGKDKRLQTAEEFTKGMKPSQALPQSQENQKRLQTQLSLVEKQRSEAYATVDKYGNRTAVTNKRIAYLDKLLKDYQTALQKEQTRALLLDPVRGVRGVFDPSTGEAVPR